MENKMLIDLMNCYGFRLGLADDLSKQPGLNDNEILSIHTKLAQCELIAEIIGKYTNNYSASIDFNLKSKEILNRI